jgi:hypothetical protein
MQYYYSLDGQDKKGPVDESQLISLGVKADSLVWSENMNDWAPAAQVDALSYLFRDDKTVMQNIPKISEVPKIPVNQQPPMPQTHFHPQPSYSSAPAKPDNYLVWAILSTVLCCLPLGIVSIINSTKVDNLYQQGKYEEAQETADKAKKYAIYGAIIGAVAMLIYILIILAS